MNLNMGNIIKSVHEYTLIKESKSPLNPYEDFRILLQLKDKRGKQAIINIFTKNGDFLGAFESDDRAKTELQSMSGGIDCMAYLVNFNQKSVRLKKGVVLNDVESMIVTIPRKTSNVGDNVTEIGGKKGFLVTDSIASTGPSKQMIERDGLVSKSKTGLAFGFYSAPSGKFTAYVDKKDGDDDHVIKKKTTPEEPLFSIEAEFAFDSSDVNKDNKKGYAPKDKIDEVLSKLDDKLNDELEVVIYAYASKEGKEDYNQKLSNKRAKAVAEYINSKDIKLKVVKAKGLGETEKFGEGDDEEQLSKNRRLVAYKKTEDPKL